MSGRLLSGSPQLVADLERLAAAVDDAPLRLPLDEAVPVDRERRLVGRIIRERLIPRLTDADAPLVAGVFGPTGSGKSLLLNAIAGRVISASGPLRPTTEVPFLWAHRHHAGRYWHELLATVRARSGPEVESMVSDDPLIRHLTIMDTPPIDVAAGGGPHVEDLLTVTDLCVFVTSAGRYADAATWEFLRAARDEAVPVIFVLNRVPAIVEERRAVVADFATRLSAAGLLLDPDPDTIFTVIERGPGTGAEKLADAVAPIRAELDRLNDSAIAGKLIDQSLSAALHRAVSGSKRVVAALDDEQDVRIALVDAVEQAYRPWGKRVADSLATGRWASLAGASPETVAEAFAGAVSRYAGAAAQEAAAAWEGDPVGAALLASGPMSLWRHGPTAGPHAAAAASSWRAELPGRVDAHGRRRRHRRRPLVRSLADTVLSGENSSDLLARRLGADQASRLVDTARAALVAGFQQALASDAARFVDAVGDPRDEETAAARLAAAADAVLERLEVAVS